MKKLIKYFVSILILIPIYSNAQTLSSIELIDNGNFENEMIGYTTEYDSIPTFIDEST